MLSRTRALLILGAIHAVGCSAASDPATPLGGGNTTASGGTGPLLAGGGTGGLIIAPPTAGTTSEPSNEGEIIIALPPGFTPGKKGGYRLVAPLAPGAAGGAEDKACANVIRTVIRDFASEHPDFEVGGGQSEGLVSPLLPVDRKPTLAPEWPTGSTTTRENFAQWYRNVDGVNLPFILDLWLEPAGSVFSFDSDAFFPLDPSGFPERMSDGNGQEHNYHFTTEMHLEFKYEGGETFTFRGDDDVWVYINGKLAIDLGGIHGPLEKSIDLDTQAATLELVQGGVYTLDLFHAERHVTGSNFRIDTTLDFTGCGIILPIDLPR